MKTRYVVLLLVIAFAISTAAMAAAPIKIGGLFDLTGKAQNIGVATRDVALMAVDRINKQGGVNGRKIELIIEDTQSEPGQAVVQLRKLVQKDQVVAIIGPTTTGAAMACMGAIEESKIPVVATVGGDAPVTPARPWVFKTPQKTSTAVMVLFNYLRGHKLNTIALLGAADKFGQEGEAVLKDLAPKYGISIVAQESFGPMDQSMTVQLTKVTEKKPKAIVVWTIGPAGAIIAKNAQQAGIKTPLFQCHGQPDANYIRIAGTAANGTMMPATKLMAAAQLAKSDPQKKVELDFIKEFNARKLGAVGTHSGYAWDAVQIVALGIKKAGTNPEKLRAAIENTKGYVGVSGIYNMTKMDHAGLGFSSMVMVKVVNGKYVMAK